MQRQRHRRAILSTIWDSYEQEWHFQKFQKRTSKWEEQQKVLEATKEDFWDKAKQAVLEKYVTYCKNMYIDDVMKWRLKFLACRFPPDMKNILQFRMLLQKGSANAKTKFTDGETGALRKDYDNLGDKVTKTPPLLDPNLSLENAKKLHHDYINGVGFESEREELDRIAKMDDTEA